MMWAWVITIKIYSHTLVLFLEKKHFLIIKVHLISLKLLPNEHVSFDRYLNYKNSLNAYFVLPHYHSNDLKPKKYR